MKSFSFSFICLLLLNYSARAQEDNHSFTESFRVKEPAQLVIASDDGNIEVLSSDEKRIAVYYIVKMNNQLLKISRAELQKEVTLETASGANSLNISIKYPKNLRLPGTNNHISVSLKIYVPKQTTCDLKTSDGNIRITGLTSDQDLKTSDGNIQTSNIRGSVKGYTSDGNILGKDIQGAVDFKTSDGNISLENIVGNVLSSTSDGNIKAANVRGNLSLKTSDGHIEFMAIKGSVTAGTSDGNIKGNIVELQRKLSLETSDGTIEVTIPDGLGLNLNIKASAIHAPLKNFSGKSDSHSIQGQLNGGGIPVDLKASDGRVNLITGSQKN